jgi:tetratricopeptide (TPR) repeat protein
LHFGRFAEAGEAFQSVRAASPDYARSMGRAGAAFWRQYIDEATKAPHDREPEKLAEALERARQNLSIAVTEYKKNLKTDADMPLDMVEAALNLADASIEASQPADAVRLMQDLIPKIPKMQSSRELKRFELQALVALLRGCIAIKDLRAAEETIKSIEKTGQDLAQITRVYLDLGKQLQAEMERLKASGDKDKYDRTRASYVAFLDQIAVRREGQTFLTLQWTGEAYFGLEMYEQASGRFSQIVRQNLADPQFLDMSKPENRAALVQAKLRYVTSLRKLTRFAEAWSEIKPLPPESNTAKDPMHVGPTTSLDIVMERGMVLEEWGATMPSQLKIAIDHWAYWGQQLERLSPRPAQYWDVRLHLVRCLVARARSPIDAKDRDQRLKQAEQQLLLLTKTSSSMGGPALKSQFDRVQRELEKELGRPLETTPRSKVTANPTGRQK